MFTKTHLPQHSAVAAAATPPASLFPPEEVFLHRHTKDDVFRQRHVLSRLAASHAAGQAALPTVVAVLRAAVARHADGAEQLAPELAALLRAGATPPPRRPSAESAANARARGELLDVLAGVARSATDPRLREAANASLVALLHTAGWPGTAARTAESLPPSQSMAVALAEVSASAAADALAGLRM